jgi:hypothetical protein
MGACASCLGRRDKDAYDEDEENRLIYDDANGMQYGSFGDPGMNGDVDTAEVQRETDALQQVVAKTSRFAVHPGANTVWKCWLWLLSNMVDIFEIAPQEGAAQPSATHFAYAGQGARLARYQHLVSKLNNQEETLPAGGVKVDWDADDDTIELHRNRPVSVKTMESDDAPLVGTFADAAAAMKWRK